MAENSAIEWTDATVNFWWGCTKVGPGCDHCYAEAWSKRTGGSIWGAGAPRRKIKGAVALIHRLDNGYSWFYADNDRRRRVFIQSMSDLFDLEVPAEWFAEAWDHVTACDRLDIQIVTKRVSVVEKRLASIGRGWPGHAGLIISVVNQAEADRDIPRLIELKAKLGIPWIGLSMEPLLGAVMLRPEWLAALDWIIVGGESGPGARPMHPNWARSLRDQCEAADVPFLFKQWGEWTLGVNAGSTLDRRTVETADWFGGTWSFETIRGDFEFHADDEPLLFRAGKKAAGRALDGRTHDGFPLSERAAGKGRGV